jgi:hypothetical protein
VPTAADEEHAQAPVASWDPVQQPVAVVAGEAGEAVPQSEGFYSSYSLVPDNESDDDPPCASRNFEQDRGHPPSRMHRICRGDLTTHGGWSAI